MRVEHIGDATLYLGDCLESLKTMPDKSIQMCVTSPPYYGLRDYGVDGQIGLEKTPNEYIAKLVEIFREVKRVLKDDGILWVNIGDSYAGSGGAGGDYNNGGLKDGQPKWKSKLDIKASNLKPKNLIGIPWMLAFALRSDGWYLRQDIIWAKPNPMPESVKDRCTKSHEYIFLLSKSAHYYYDADAIAEPSTTYENRPAGVVRDRLYGYDSKQNKIRVKLGSKSFSKGQANGAGIEPTGNTKKDYYEVPFVRNRRDIWTIKSKPYNGAHFAVFPPEIPRLCILAGSKPGDTILDPFAGSGTTGAVAISLRRRAVLCELNVEYVGLIRERITNEEAFYQPTLNDEEEL